MLFGEVSNHLKDDIIPFWRNLKDTRYGGYYGYVDNHLKVDRKAPKGAIYHHRILWFFSNAYYLLKDSDLLEEADHAYEFIMSNFIDSIHGGSYWSVTYDGKVLDSSKYTYCQAFLIYALSSYYSVSGRKAALDMAYRLFELVEDQCRDDFGYLEGFDREFNPIPNEQISENGIVAEKTMNTLLHVFEAYSEFYKVTGDRQVKRRLMWILDIFTDKVYNPKLKRQEVFFNSKMESMIDLHSYGHDIETAWLLDRGCEIIGDMSYTERIKPITRQLTKMIYDKAYTQHSVMNGCENGVDDTTRVWWVQAESMVGFLNGYEDNKHNQHYMEAVQNIWSYVKDNMLIQSKPAEWYAEVTEEGHVKMSKPPVEEWKAPYHNGRMCIELMKRLKSS